MKIRNILCGALALLVAACSGKNGWEVNGTLTNVPDGTKVAIQGYTPGIWYTLDSVEVSKSGQFSYRADSAVVNPDIFRVALDNQYVYFPVTDREALTITGDASDLEGTYDITGSDLASQIKAIDQDIRKRMLANGVDAVLGDADLKRQLNQQINVDTVGIIGFYIINKTIGDKPLYNPADRMDVKMLNNVAQTYATYRPDDPRTKILEQQLMDAKRALGNTTGQVIEIEGDGFLDIALVDEQGREQKLSDMVAANPVVLLSFTSYQMEPSLAYNHELYKTQEAIPGVAIYQVAIDDNEIDWRETADNLPWTTVRYDEIKGQNLLTMYNVGVIPLTYVIVNGDIVERVLDPTTLPAVIRAHQ